jgi:hypothetical protein
MNEQRNFGAIGQSPHGASCDGNGFVAHAIGASLGDACGRQSAKGVIRDRVRQLRSQADELEALARALPEELPPQADAVLWRLVIDARR